MTAHAIAIEQVRAQFPSHELSVISEGNDTVVIIENVHVGDQYTPSTTWFGFRISAAYPSADVYPHYIGTVARGDGSAHGQGISPSTWQERPALQLSRASRGWNPRRDNAALKAAKVLAWLAAL